MGIESFLVSTTVNMILAQRLVRKICKHCITSYTLKDKEIKLLEQAHDISFETITKMIAKTENASKKENDPKGMLFFKGKGCNKCNNTGYKGRIGIYEVLENSEKISELILERAGAEKIKNQAISDGMLTIMEDGFIKAKSGITTIEEVLRVTKE